MLLSPWNSPGRDTGVCSHFLLQGISSQPRDQTWVSCTAGRFFTFAPGHCSKYTTSPYDSAIPLLGIHSSIIYNCQDREAILVSISRWKDKEDVIQIYNVILLSHQKEQNFWTSWVIQWLRIHLPVGTRVWFLVRELTSHIPQGH